MARLKFKKKRGKKPAVSVVLPEEKSEPMEDLWDYTILMYGRKKIGKTSLWSQHPDAFFLMTEPGGKGLRIFQPMGKDKKPRHIRDWPTFKAYVEALQGRPYGLHVLDTVDSAYELCFEHMCKHVLYIEHPHEEKDFGMSWKAIADEFKSELRKLMSLPSGFVMISHERTREIETFEGAAYEQVQNSLSGRIGEWVTGITDMWMYYGYHGEERRLYLQGGSGLDAGNRLMDEHFNWKGKPLRYIPMGTSAKDAYQNLLAAYNNELEVRERKVKKKKKLKVKV